MKPFLPSAPDINEKYSYIIEHPIILKILYVIGALSWFFVLIGYVHFFNHDIWYWIFFAPIIFYLTIYQYISIFINLFYRKFDLKAHNHARRVFWKHIDHRPTIDVFLPVCGEDIAILENTWWGVMTMKNDAKYILNPVVLDDADNPRVAVLASKFHFQYHSRSNRGEMKKAGNLKYGFERTKGDFIIIFDADFKPRYDFIEELLPYMSDEKIGIVQSPQFFDFDRAMHGRSWIEYGAGNVQSYFYRIIQRSRDAFGGSICVGSCAIYRRKALESVGGTAQVEHSEDVHTGFKLVSNGWRIKYVPMPLSKGVCPSDLMAFFKQQTRWCSGSMSMMTNAAFWKSDLPYRTKLCYISGFMYYISNPLKLLLIVQSVFLFAFHAESIGLANVFVFLPTIMTSMIIQYFYIYPRARLGTFLTHASITWFYSYTLINLLLGHVEGWNPTGRKQKNSLRFMGIYFVAGIYVSFSIGLMMVMSHSGHIDFGSVYYFPSIFWDTLAIVYHGMFFLYGCLYLFEKNSQTIKAYIHEHRMLQKLLLPALLIFLPLSALVGLL